MSISLWQHATFEGQVTWVAKRCVLKYFGHINCINSHATEEVYGIRSAIGFF